MWGVLTVRSPNFGNVEKMSQGTGSHERPTVYSTHCDENGKKLACLVLSYARDKGARRTNELPVTLITVSKSLAITPRSRTLVQSIAFLDGYKEAGLREDID